MESKTEAESLDGESLQQALTIEKSKFEQQLHNIVSSIVVLETFSYEFIYYSKTNTTQKSRNMRFDLGKCKFDKYVLTKTIFQKLCSENLEKSRLLEEELSASDSLQSKLEQENSNLHNRLQQKLNDYEKLVQVQKLTEGIICLFFRIELFYSIWVDLMV